MDFIFGPNDFIKLNSKIKKNRIFIIIFSASALVLILLSLICLFKVSVLFSFIITSITSIALFISIFLVIKLNHYYRSIISLFSKAMKLGTNKKGLYLGKNEHSVTLQNILYNEYFFLIDDKKMSIYCYKDKKVEFDNKEYILLLYKNILVGVMHD